MTNGSTTNPLPIELQYVDVAWVCANSEDELRTIVSTFFRKVYKSMDLTLNICKMMVLHQLARYCGVSLPIIEAHGEALENIGHFQYFWSVLLTKGVIDEEVQHCVQYASAAFGCLRKRVFEDNIIRFDTKPM
eukprot:g23882.t1